LLQSLSLVAVTMAFSGIISGFIRRDPT